MEPVSELLNLLEPASIALMVTAVLVTFGSAFRAFNYWKQMESNSDMFKLAITLNRLQTLMIPVIGSFMLVLMFYLFSSLSQLFTALIVNGSVSWLFLSFLPYVNHLRSQLGFADPCIWWFLTRSQALLLVSCFGIVVAWLVSGNWILNNLIGISGCIVGVSYIRLPNIKICAMLLACLFMYDIFWVFCSESFFGANVMLTVATQHASNPVHTFAKSFNLPGLQLITEKFKMPGTIVFPGNLFGGAEKALSFHMLGVGDMALPSMLLALVLCFDYRKSQNTVSLLGFASSKGHKYTWYAISGYAIGLIAASAAGILTNLPQPALLYLVPSTLGPVVIVSWKRGELGELWEGSVPKPKDKTHVHGVWNLDLLFVPSSERKKL